MTSPRQLDGDPPQRTPRARTTTVGFLFGLTEIRELPGPFLIEVLQKLGLTASGARSYMTRALKEGRLTSRRQGRTSFYAMTGDYLERFDAIERRFTVEPVWEGFFHSVVYDLPESRRTERDGLRAAAFAHGWGCPRPGLLIGVDPPGPWAQDGWRGRLSVDLETARQMAAASWNLDSAAARVTRTVTRLRADMERTDTASPSGKQTMPATAWEPLVRAHDLMSEATYLWGLLPRLPHTLLPRGFPISDLDWLDAQMSGPLISDGVSAARSLLAAHLDSR